MSMEEEGQASSCAFFFSFCVGNQEPPTAAYIYLLTSDFLSSSQSLEIPPYCNPQTITLTSKSREIRVLITQKACAFKKTPQITKLEAFCVIFLLFFFVSYKMGILETATCDPCTQETCEPVNPGQIELSWFLANSKAITWLQYALELSQSTLGWVRAMFLAWSNVFQHAACFFHRLSNTWSAAFSGVVVLPFFWSKCIPAAWPLWSCSHSLS